MCPAQGQTLRVREVNRVIGKNQAATGRAGTVRGQNQRLIIDDLAAARGTDTGRQIKIIGLAGNRLPAGLPNPVQIQVIILIANQLQAIEGRTGPGPPGSTAGGLLPAGQEHTLVIEQMRSCLRTAGLHRINSHQASGRCTVSLEIVNIRIYLAPASLQDAAGTEIIALAGNRLPAGQDIAAGIEIIGRAINCLPASQDRAIRGKIADLTADRLETGLAHPVGAQPVSLAIDNLQPGNIDAVDI